MQVRRLGEGDSLIAGKILKDFLPAGANNLFPSQRYLDGWLTNRSCYLLAAFENEEICGFVLAYSFPSFYANENTAYVYDIEVLANHRRRGIGRQLVKQLMRHLKWGGINEVWLGTAVENSPAQLLFSSTGAQKEEDAFYEYFYYLKENADDAGI